MATAQAVAVALVVEEVVVMEEEVAAAEANKPEISVILSLP
jgi:hypothetical protein